MLAKECRTQSKVIPESSAALQSDFIPLVYRQALAAGAAAGYPYSKFTLFVLNWKLPTTITGLGYGFLERHLETGDQRLSSTTNTQASTSAFIKENLRCEKDIGAAVKITWPRAGAENDTSLPRS